MNNSEFNVEDAFFGALLGAWCSSVAGIWTEVISVILFALLFLLFGIFFRVLSSDQISRKWKVHVSIWFTVISIIGIGRLYYTISPKDRNQVTFFALILVVWVAICGIKLVLTIMSRRTREE